MPGGGVGSGSLSLTTHCLRGPLAPLIRKGELLVRAGDHAPQPLAPLPEADICANWSEVRPVVSVLCPTFQHVDFIEDALSGFLGQRTDFPFEIVIRDDASSDGTVEILRRYEGNYPSIIRLILEEENQWPEVWPLNVLMGAAKGEFVAFCEGDDYWFHPNKLQMQVDYLRKHPGTSLVETDRLDIESGWITGIARGGTRTYVLRRADLGPAELAALQGVPHPDIAIRLILATKGRLAALPVVTSVWRFHPGGGFGPRGRTDPRSIQIDDLRSIFLVGAALQDMGVSSAGELAARQLVVRVCGAMGVGPRWVIPKVFLPTLRGMTREKLQSGARRRRLRRFRAAAEEQQV